MNNLNLDSQIDQSTFNHINITLNELKIGALDVTAIMTLIDQVIQMNNSLYGIYNLILASAKNHKSTSEAIIAHQDLLETVKEKLIELFDHINNPSNIGSNTSSLNDKLLELLSARLDSHDKHLEALGQHLEAHDGRFDIIGNHLETHDMYLNTHDKHLEAHDMHLKSLSR